MKMLFQGDSITDAAENFGGIVPGYVYYIRQWMQKHYPDIECINKGVSGDCTINLVKRWQVDTIDLKPDIVSIMIGVNDVWRKIDSLFETADENFEKNYRTILNATKAIGAKILMIQPYIIRHGYVTIAWEDEYLKKKKIVDKLATEYADEYLKLGDIFDAECLENDGRLFTVDGIHPSAYGSKFIAEEVEKILYRLFK